MVTVQFTPFSSTVSPAFWHTLAKLKLDILKLDQGVIPVIASYAAGRTIKYRETGADVALPSSVTVAEDAFQELKDVQPPPGSTLAVGKIKIYNTIEDFKNADKQTLFNEIADEASSYPLCSRTHLPLSKGPPSDVDCINARGRRSRSRTIEIPPHHVR